MKKAAIQKASQKTAASNHDYRKDPISAVEWVHRDTLTANEYNPNKQASPELDLLLTSLLENGFTQPIVRDDKGNIIDGFHRYMLSEHPKMMERYKGMVPVVTLTNLSQEKKMMATVRHNRARGTHSILPMADIVLFMVDKGLSVPEIMKGLGMEKEEVMRLSMRGGVAKNEVEKGTWSKSWKPKFQ